MSQSIPETDLPVPKMDKFFYLIRPTIKKPLANSVDPDQLEADLGLRCLTTGLLKPSFAEVKLSELFDRKANWH